jgi:Secretion system C-terminal sorting domain
MKRYIIILFLLTGSASVLAQKIDSRINRAVDNQAYWKKMAEAGLVKLNPVVPVKKADFKGTAISSPMIAVTNSADVAIINTAGITQSENSIAISPINKLKALNSNNSQSVSVLGTSGFRTANQGASWSGSINGTGGSNKGDPAADISNNNRYYVGYINNASGQGVAVSTNEGVTWQSYTVAPLTGGATILDKNHLWVDKSISSPHANNVYSAWTSFSGTNDRRIVFSRSVNGGINWSPGINISGAAGGPSLHQGVNINSGPNGEVYACWAVYDDNSGIIMPTENSIRFARSTNGGVSFSPPQIIADNIQGIRFAGVGKAMRVNSFPSMTVDNSFGPNRGTIYAVWANLGVPGKFSGNDVDIYMVRSVNGGVNWSAPIKVNFSVARQSRKNYFPWITCDQTTGKLHVIYYSDRNVNTFRCETFLSSSFDGGLSWTDVRISDVSFEPSPIPGLAPDYFGDYLGITANDDVVYPVWTDNRTGAALAYTSPIISADFCSNALTLQNITMPLPATFKYRSENTIDVAGGATSFTMQGNGTSGARVSMIAANSITLSPNTDIQFGTVLTIQPGPCSSPVLRSTGNPDETFVSNTVIREDFELGSEINLYPNPARDAVNIQLSSKITIADEIPYTITDLMGKAIQRGIITKAVTSLNIGSLEAGGYFLNLYQSGKLLETKKLIKQ